MGWQVAHYEVRFPGKHMHDLKDMLQTGLIVLIPDGCRIYTTLWETDGVLQPASILPLEFGPASETSGDDSSLENHGYEFPEISGTHLPKSLGHVPVLSLDGIIQSWWHPIRNKGYKFSMRVSD